VEGNSVQLKKALEQYFGMSPGSGSSIGSLSSGISGMSLGGSSSAHPSTLGGLGGLGGIGISQPSSFSTC
jgi:hypothetical protein